MKDYQLQSVREQWERAVQRATEDQTQRQEADAIYLDGVAGLRVVSGVKAGHAWIGTKHSSDGCSGWCD